MSFPQHGEFVYAFLNPHFSCLSLQVQKLYSEIIIPSHPSSAQIVPSPLKMINLLLVFAVSLELICFYLTKQNEPLGDTYWRGQWAQK